MASEIVFLITEQRNKQRITLPAGSYRFGRSAQCEYVLRRNNVGEVQFVVACTKDGWTVTDSSTECATWYDNRYLNQGETCPLQEGDVLGLNTDGNASTQEITFRVEEIRTAQSGETGLRQEQTDNAAKSGCSSAVAMTATSSLSATAYPAITAKFCTRTATTSCAIWAPPTAPMWTVPA